MSLPLSEMLQVRRSVSDDNCDDVGNRYVDPCTVRCTDDSGLKVLLLLSASPLEVD